MDAALTPRQREVLLLVAEGLTNADLKRVPRTVPVVVLLGDRLYGTDQAQTYSARAGRLGRSR